MSLNSNPASEIIKKILFKTKQLNEIESNESLDC
jgi:hypothetical protein